MQKLFHYHTFSWNNMYYLESLVNSVFQDFSNNCIFYNILLYDLEYAWELAICTYLDTNNIFSKLSAKYCNHCISYIVNRNYTTSGLNIPTDW